MIISDFYQTKIETFDKKEYDDGNGFVPCYSLDSTASKNELIVKVTLIDFNNNAVRNREVQLSVNIGSFALTDVVTSKAFTNVKNKKIIKGTTNADGAIYALFSVNPAERGICTFMANNIMVQVDNINPYPVGSIYMSINDTNPSLLFGGEWVQLKDRFLLGAGVNYSRGEDNEHSVGGEASHTLTENEMPSHNHTQAKHSHSPGSSRKFLTAPSGSTWGEVQGANVSGSGWHYIGTSNKSNFDVYVSNSGEATPAINKTGGGKAHNNMPPYLIVYMWQRTG